MSNIDSRESLEADDPYVVTLNHPTAADRALVGGKEANLARLVEAGFPVPDGFCVTTLAYWELIDDDSIDALLDDLSNLDPTDTEALAAVGSSLRACIENQDVTPSIREAIENALANVEAEAGSETAYAVRSSATAEDLPDASFAGQQETFLNVRGADDIVDRIRDCMASLFTDRAIAYRARNDIPHKEVALAVVVQRMVTPDAAGILFTADSQTGNRRVTTIEAGIGLGEVLVSGEVNADTVHVDTRTGKILGYEVGNQGFAVQPLEEGGTKTVELDDRDNRVLSDKQVRTLVERGTEIEALFECPQDIEWCLADGDLYIVQARPITSLFPLPSPEPEDDRLHVYLSFGHVQAFAEAMPPLVRDVWMAYIRLWMTEVGMDPDTQWFVEAGGRLYIDMTTLLRVGVFRRQIPDQLAEMSESVGAAFENVLARRGEEFRSDRTVRDTLAALPRFAGMVGWGIWMGFPIMSSMFSGFFSAFVGEPNPPEREETKWTDWGRDVAAGVRAPDTPIKRVNAGFNLSEQAIHYPPTGPLFPDTPEDVNDVAKGLPVDLVTRINLGLGDLADVARDHPEVVEALREDASLEEIEACEGGEAFRAVLDEYLEEFGHRAAGEIDVSRPRWRENPSGLLATVRANLKHEGEGEHREHLRKMEREAKAAAERLEQRADHGLLGPIQKRFVRRLIRTYRGYIQTREYPKQGVSYLFAAWHETFQEAGERLADEGRLADSDDVWLLREDELLAALEGDSIDVDLAARRAEFERHAAMDAPPVLTSEGEAPSAVIDTRRKEWKTWVAMGID